MNLNAYETIYFQKEYNIMTIIYQLNNSFYDYPFDWKIHKNYFKAIFNPKQMANSHFVSLKWKTSLNKIGCQHSTNSHINRGLTSIK